MQQINTENPDMIQAGDELEWEGKKLMAIGQFTSGTALNKSGLRYFIPNLKGAMGLQEV